MASCSQCGAKRGHLPGCPSGGGGGGGGGGKTPKKVPKHPHQWKWKRRGGGVLGGYWDLYVCEYPGCPATKEVPV